MAVSLLEQVLTALAGSGATEQEGAFAPVLGEGGGPFKLGTGFRVAP
jgi:hypothetical protein